MTISRTRTERAYADVCIQYAVSGMHAARLGKDHREGKNKWKRFEFMSADCYGSHRRPGKIPPYLTRRRSWVGPVDRVPCVHVSKPYLRSRHPPETWHFADGSRRKLQLELRAINCERQRCDDVAIYSFHESSDILRSIVVQPDREQSIHGVVQCVPWRGINPNEPTREIDSVRQRGPFLREVLGEFHPECICLPALRKPHGRHVEVSGSDPRRALPPQRLGFAGSEVPTYAEVSRPVRNHGRHSAGCTRRHGHSQHQSYHNRTHQCHNHSPQSHPPP